MTVISLNRSSIIANLISMLVIRPRCFFDACKGLQPRTLQIVADLERKYGKDPILKTVSAESKFYDVLTRLNLNMMKLTERQLHMMYLLNFGLQPKEIAGEMGIEVDSVRDFQKQVRQKWQVSTEVAIAIFETEIGCLVLAAHSIRDNPTQPTKQILGLLQPLLMRNEAKVRHPIAGGAATTLVFGLSLLFGSQLVLREKQQSLALPKPAIQVVASIPASVRFIEINTTLPSWEPAKWDAEEDNNSNHSNSCSYVQKKLHGCDNF